MFTARLVWGAWRAHIASENRPGFGGERGSRVLNSVEVLVPKPLAVGEQRRDGREPLSVTRRVAR